jgi:hypothetical protein
MKTAWDRYIEQQLTNPIVRMEYESELKSRTVELNLSKNVHCPTNDCS